MSARDTYVEQLQAEIVREQSMRTALIEEFRESMENSAEFSPEDLKKRFYGLLPIAFEKLTFLISSSDSEAVQLSAIKYVFGIATGQVKITNENDPDAALKDLISSLAVNNTA